MITPSPALKDCKSITHFYQAITTNFNQAFIIKTAILIHAVLYTSLIAFHLLVRLVILINEVEILNNTQIFQTTLKRELYAIQDSLEHAVALQAIAILRKTF